MNGVGFYFLAILICAFALLSVTVRNVFHSAIWLALVLLSVAGIYFYLDSNFLGVAQLLVYVGGIMTVFIFAIKLTAKISDQTIRQVNHQFWAGTLFAVALFVVVAQIAFDGPWKDIVLSAPPTPLKTIGIALVTDYALPFEFISLLLLAALVGAIILGKVKS